MGDDKLLTREEVLWIEDALVAKDKRIVELEGAFFDHLVYLHDNYPDVYQDPAIPAFEDYESEGGADD